LSESDESDASDEDQAASAPPLAQLALPQAPLLLGEPQPQDGEPPLLLMRRPALRPRRRQRPLQTMLVLPWYNPATGRFEEGVLHPADCRHA